MAARAPGAIPVPGGVRFRVWAPGHWPVEVLVEGREAVELAEEDDGWHVAFVAEIGAGARYRFRLGGDDALLVPDPASRSQPDGVSGPSEVVDPASFRWSDRGWRGIALEDAILYELHVGAFTPKGTFDAAATRLDYLCELGVTALEIMPVAEFPGRRNWGYDGVFPFAPQSGYGGPDGLRRLVDAAHRAGLAVVLDVVYNHLGPEGNVLPAVTGGRIFTDRHRTPWGAAINFDDEGSRNVRDFFIANALHWVREYHVDGLRLDATHAIVDDSKPHFLRELADRVRAGAGRPVLLIAEDERNERRLVTPLAEGGYGLDAVWADDAHHQVRRLVAGDREGYYAAYGGTAAELADTLRRGWFHAGPAGGGEGGRRGTPAEAIAPERFVHCIQNHDQVGNRAFGKRLNHQIEPALYRAASALLLLGPYTPLLWMGQEWAASSPFLYFTDHPEELGRLVTEGRRSEFADFSDFRDPARRESIPDPQSPRSFERSKLRWEERDSPPHREVLALYRELLRLRKEEPAMRARARESWSVASVGPDGSSVIALRRRAARELLILANLGGATRVDLPAAPETRVPDGSRWEIVLSTEEARFGGPDDAAAARFEDDTAAFAGAAAMVAAARQLS